MKTEHILFSTNKIIFQHISCTYVVASFMGVIAIQKAEMCAFGIR